MESNNMIYKNNKIFNNRVGGGGLERGIVLLEK